MSLDLAIRLIEIFLALSFVQQSFEHLYQPKERAIFIVRILLCVFVLLDFYASWVLGGLWLTSVLLLHRYNGPYNGGSDRIGILTLSCLCGAHWLPQWQEAFIGYLAIQLLLSYVISGWVKIINPHWRNGRALEDVFAFSVYPACETFRELAKYPKLLWFVSWAVIVFELIFPVFLLSKVTLYVSLCFALIFHLSNCYFLGLNRFVWSWLAAYPALIWLQHYVFGYVFPLF